MKYLRRLSKSALHFTKVAALFTFCFLSPSAFAETNDALRAYFRAETAKLAEACLTHVKSVSDWETKRVIYKKQLWEMLGLPPENHRPDLKPVITGKIEHDDFIVEKLHFQSLPQLYVTANFYLPKNVKTPLPTILYVCGHAKVVTNGVSYGNKTAYQHHGAWFARNGYACLIVDTLQLGEIEGIHHGTHREKMWWWNSRGYTPAGVETWNNIRALDYLETRPEVDKTRFGVTGRSGGGAYSWTLTAVDDRIKVAVPVAGITDNQNYIVDDCVEGHCDCMFFVNTHKWDYPLLAAMAAPRALLIANSDKDRIFPLEGIVRLHAKVREIYRLYKATNNLGLLITEGPHSDTQDLQLPAFRWFNRHLKGEDPVIEMAAKKFFAPEQLKVFETLPADQINTRIHDLFVPFAQEAEFKSREDLQRKLRLKVFAGWPIETTAPGTKQSFSFTQDEVLFSAHDFVSQSNVVLRLYLAQPAGLRSVKKARLHILDEKSWRDLAAAWRSGFGENFPDLAQTNDESNEAFARFKTDLVKYEGLFAFVAPRAIGPTAWTGNEREQTHLRRRYMLLGQTLDGMRVWDIRRAAQTVRQITTANVNLELQPSEGMKFQTAFANIFEPNTVLLTPVNFAEADKNAPDFLNWQRFVSARELSGAISVQK